MVKKIIRRKEGASFQIEVKPMGEDGVVEEQVPEVLPQVGQEQPKPEVDALMGAVEEMQDAVANIGSRLDKVENKPIEDSEQEVPTMEQNLPGELEGEPKLKQLAELMRRRNQLDDELKKGKGACDEDELKKVEEMVNFGGEDKPADFSGMDEKGKDSGATKDPVNVMQEAKKLTKMFLKRMEDLTGHPEVPRGKTSVSGPASPKNINPLPATGQPAAGVAPSGGDFDSKDKWAEGEEAEPGNKPKKDFPKLPYQKNRLKRRESAVTAGGPEDPTRPQPAASQDKPDPMSMETPKEEFEGEDVLDKKKDELVNEILGKIRKELRFEKLKDDEEEEVTQELFKNKPRARKSTLHSRQSFAGGSRRTNAPASRVSVSERMRVSNPERANVREAVMDTVKEYLKKPGVCSRADLREFGL